MKVLILTGKFGMGHYSASYSIEEQLKTTIQHSDITIVDIFDYSLPHISKHIYQSFNFLINRASICYNIFYKQTENGNKSSKPIFADYFFKSIEQLLLITKPTVIISTIPYCSQLISYYKKKSDCDIPLITCITDISSHSEWINEQTDYYLVGSPSVQAELIEKGIPINKIHVMGIPVKLAFKEKPITPHPPKKNKHLLIMGGGLGLLPKSKKFYQELNNLKNIKTTVITGGNKRLYHQLHQKYDNIEVIGFTDQVYNYMQQADLIISKPGGITVFEAIHSELPMLIIEPFLQQEMKNANFIHHHHLGCIIPKQQIVDINYLSQVLNDETNLYEMRKNMKSLKKQLDDNALENIILSYQDCQLGA